MYTNIYKIYRTDISIDRLLLSFFHMSRKNVIGRGMLYVECYMWLSQVTLKISFFTFLYLVYHAIPWRLSSVVSQNSLWFSNWKFPDRIRLSITKVFQDKVFQFFRKVLQLSSKPKIKCNSETAMTTNDAVKQRNNVE